MGMLITPWHGDHDKRSNCSQLVPIEFKSGPSYVKHTIVHHISRKVTIRKLRNRGESVIAFNCSMLEVFVTTSIDQTHHMKN